ncbi:hypothetical protein PV04_10939 [Phialophora macrospora]|uniref:Uncharacterized protein n=1 Tax=Phialophora macrospora TaxID=1851006 RepID=A0A0D2F4H3_9EURO|nr:hypothetical protein PV04_10939 [Phialophora macrospora]
MSLKVYKVRSNTIPDPDMPGRRYHTALFVQNTDNDEGTIHQVTGDLVTGMTYEVKRAQRPEDSQDFHDKELLGTVEPSQYPAFFDQICRQQPPPPKQKKFNLATRRTEQTKSDGSFYAPGEQKAPMIKCTEWTELQAIPALIKAGILKMQGSEL